MLRPVSALTGLNHLHVILSFFPKKTHYFMTSIFAKHDPFGSSPFSFISSMRTIGLRPRAHSDVHSEPRAGFLPASPSSDMPVLEDGVLFNR